MAAPTNTQKYAEAISRAGLRSTRQRHQVFEVLMEKRDHPTAVQVFMRVKEKMPTISLATVYNCLETLTECGLARHVNLERQSARYCPNLKDHGHFFCDDCGAVFDVPVRDHLKFQQTLVLPPRVRVTQHSVTLRGLCPSCVSGTKLRTKKRL